MSWQFNRTIGPRTAIETSSPTNLPAAIGTKTSPTIDTITSNPSSLPLPLSSSSSMMMYNSTMATINTPAITTTANNTNYPLATSSSDHKTLSILANTNQQQQQQQLQQQQHQMLPSPLFVGHHHGQRHPGLVDNQGLFQKFLQQQQQQHKDFRLDLGLNESLEHHQQQQQHQDLVTAIDNTILGEPVSVINPSSSCFDYLLADQQQQHQQQQQQQQQVSLLWSTYSMPIYSSYNQMNIAGQQRHHPSMQASNSATTTSTSINNTATNNILVNDSKLIGSNNSNSNFNTANIIDRFNQRDNNNNNDSSCTTSSAGGVFSQARFNFHPQQNDFMGGRSYSSVLNATGSDTSVRQQVTERLSNMFANSSSQQQFNSSSNQDFNNNNNNYDASLVPTNKSYSLSPSSSSSQQQRNKGNLFNNNNQQTNYHYNNNNFQRQQGSPIGAGRLGSEDHQNHNNIAGTIGYLNSSRPINSGNQPGIPAIGPHSKRLNNISSDSIINRNNNKFPSLIFNNSSSSSSATTTSTSMSMSTASTTNNQSLITTGSDNQQHSGVLSNRNQDVNIVNYANSSNNNNMTGNHTRSNRHQHHQQQSAADHTNSSSSSSSNNINNNNNNNINYDNDLNEDGERYSRKVFVGGLPPDIDEEEIKSSFRRFGSLIVDWPHKAESKSYFPPKGYAFLLFHEESSVQALIDCCLQEDDKLYLCVSSPTIKDKPVQIRPWRLSDADFVLDSTLVLDPRKTVFVGGVPRPLKASELANIINDLYGGVCYAGIDTDPDLKYPKGAGRVAFSNHQSYISAVSARFVHLHHSEFEKKVEVKPYVLDDQFCDECLGVRCNNKFAPFFCANISCLQYYCENCWTTIHSQAGKDYHKPLVKEGGDRPRAAPSTRWN